MDVEALARRLEAICDEVSSSNSFRLFRHLVFRLFDLMICMIKLEHYPLHLPATFLKVSSTSGPPLNPQQNSGQSRRLPPAQ